MGPAMGAIALVPRGNTPLAVLVAICAIPIFFVLGLVSVWRIRRGWTIDGWHPYLPFGARIRVPQRAI